MDFGCEIGIFQFPLNLKIKNPMKDEERLYDVFGELLYALAMADGEVQQEEITELENVLASHSWAKSIKWSFNYELGKKQDIDSVYNKVIDFCHRYGPSPVYEEFISVMRKVAEAFGGVDESEEKMISSFSTDLIKRFQADLDKKSDQ